MKNKKALMVASALVRIIAGVAIFFLIIVPACNKVRDFFFSHGTESFETFVDEINKMTSDGTGEFVLQLNDNSAVVGFKSDAARYECYGCSLMGAPVPWVTFKFDKPANPECNGKACVCLCDGKFEKSVEGSTIVGTCSSLMLCKKLNMDVVDKTIIKTHSSQTEHWLNGFLFARGVIGANGLNLYNMEIMTLHMQRKASILGVCNDDMIEYNRRTLQIDECINKDYT